MLFDFSKLSLPLNEQVFLAEILEPAHLAVVTKLEIALAHLKPDIVLIVADRNLTRRA